MNLFKLGIVLVFVGMILAVIAAFLPILQLPVGEVSVSGGGCVLIGFIPVCFGVGEYALPLLAVTVALAIALIAISLAFYLYIAKRAREIALPPTAT